MEVNKVGNNFFQTSYSEIKQKQTSESQIVNENTTVETTADEDVVLNEISSVESIDDVSATKNVTESETKVDNITPTNSTSEVKSLDEYMEIVDSMYNELYEKFNGDSDQINQYIEDNMAKFADIDGDGRITLIDEMIYNCSYSSCKSKTEQDKRKSINKIKTAISNSDKNELLDLDDVERFFQISGTWTEAGRNGAGGTQSKITNQLNLIKIAQDENWEEKINSIAEKYGSSYSTGYKIPCFSDATIKQITKYADIVKNSSVDAQYSAISSAYKSYMETYNNTDWEQEAQEEYDRGLEYYETLLKDSDTKKSYENAVWTAKQNNGTYNATYEEYCWATATQGYDWYSVSSIMAKNKEALLQKQESAASRNQLCDFNGDGTIDANDLKDFSCDVDLDGDGSVSNSEKSFLQDIKEKITKAIYKKQMVSGLNNLTNIDNLVTTTENYNEDSYMKELVSTTVDSIEEQAQSDYQNQLLFGYVHEEDNLDAGDLKVIMRGSRWFFPMLSSFFGNKANEIFELFCTDEEKESNQITYDRLKEMLSNALEYSKQTTSYIRYIENSDLSKDELEEILTKINSASSSAQSQLAEVKTAVEEKLKNCSE